MLAQVLKRLKESTGKGFDPTNFPKRLRIQKSIYLLKALGYEPVAHYSFGSYVRGPYSPELARDYYSLSDHAVDRATPATIPDRYLIPVTQAVVRGNEFLEA